LGTLFYLDKPAKLRFFPFFRVSKKRIGQEAKAMGLSRKIFLWISENRTLRRKLPRYRFIRRAVSRFMPGETLEDALRAARELKQKKLASLLTLLGENIALPAEAEKVTEHYLDALSKIQEAGLDAHVSVKPTQLGLDLGEELCYQNVLAVARRASEFKNWVWIDMEQSGYVDRTLSLYKKVRTQHSNIGVCLQAYLYRTQKDIEELLPLSPGIRLVKGAYMEPPSVAHPKRSDVDASFLELSKHIFAGIKKHSATFNIGTHDSILIKQVREEAERAGVSKSEYEIQMLFGIQTAEQLQLAEEGHRVRTLVSYGSFWFPWYMRRLAERPANVLFALKNLLRN
jgi:proline dehydrogenase